jgi:malonyl-CoA O-methyltransferase
LFIFTTLGPDTLKELRAAWTQVDEHVHVHAFIDMHDIGDALVRARLAEPVMDIEYLTLTFTEVGKLARELKAIGAHNASRDRFARLTGRRRFSAMTEAYESFRKEGKIPATCEVVYGNAWGPIAAAVRGGTPGEVSVPVTRILKRSRPSNDAA